MFATLISRTAEDIDSLIESLPSEECSPALQVAIIIDLFAIGGRQDDSGDKFDESKLINCLTIV